MTKKLFELVKGYAFEWKYEDYLWQYFFTTGTMKFFWTSSVVYDITVDNETIWVLVTNKKAYWIQKVYYMFDIVNNEKTTKCLYSIEDVNEYIKSKIV